jgi:hypothetical protein
MGATHLFVVLTVVRVGTHWTFDRDTINTLLDSLTRAQHVVEGVILECEYQDVLDRIVTGSCDSFVSVRPVCLLLAINWRLRPPIEVKALRGVTQQNVHMRREITCSPPLISLFLRSPLAPRYHFLTLGALGLLCVRQCIREIGEPTTKPSRFRSI